MPINQDDFIFHSDFLSYPRINSTASKVTVSGTVGVGANITFYGNELIDIGINKTQSVIKWRVPSASWVAAANEEMQVGVWKKGQYAVNKQGTQGGQPTGIWAFPFVSVSSGKARAAIKLYNNQTTVLTVPTTTFDTAVSTYAIPL